MSTKSLATPDEDFWVKRGVRYLDTAQRAADTLLRSLAPEVCCQLYKEVSAEWFAETPYFPKSQGREKQEDFYKSVDMDCASLEIMAQDDWRGIIRICCAAQAGIQAVAIGGFQFPEESLFRTKVWECVATNVKALNKSRLQARQEAAGHSTLSATRRVTPEALGLSVDESVAYIHPETDKVIKFSVIGFGMSKSKGRWFTVTYPGDPDVEVELTEEEVKDMLITRIYIDELEDE